MTAETYLNWTSEDPGFHSAQASIFNAKAIDQFVNGPGRWIAVVESGQFRERRGFPTKDDAMIWCESTVFRLAKELVELSKLAGLRITEARDGDGPPRGYANGKWGDRR